MHRRKPEASEAIGAHLAEGVPRGRRPGGASADAARFKSGSSPRRHPQGGPHRAWPPALGDIPVCGDASLVSALHADGTIWPRAADRDGVALARARRLHRTAYPELADGTRGRLVVLGTELGGRWAPEAITLLRCLAEAKSRSSPALLRRSAQLAWYQRWIRMLSVASQTALAEALTRPVSPHYTEMDGDTPDLSDILCMDREGPSISRLPPR